MAYRILGAPISPFVRKVRVFCAEKDIPYELEFVNPFDPPSWFGDVSPLRRIPVLAIDEDGSRNHLPDSSVICAFLEHKHPQRPLLPAAPLSRARALWFEEYADSDLTGTIGRGVFQPIVLARVLGREPDEALAQRTVADDLPRFYDYLESRIGDREFLVDDTLSIADIGVASPFANLQHAGFDVDPKRWPALARYLQGILGRPSFQHCLDGEREMLRQG